MTSEQVIPILKAAGFAAINCTEGVFVGAREARTLGRDEVLRALPEGFSVEQVKQWGMDVLIERVSDLPPA